MKADAVIFDKDGTLIDFDSIWVPVSVKALEDILANLHREDIPVDEFLTAFGVHDGVTDINGVLCKGTYAQMGQIVHEILGKHGCSVPCEDVVKLVVDCYNKNADAGEVKPTSPDLVDALKELKKQNVKIAIVTTDNETITRKCLRDLGIEELFDRIYTDDGVMPAKPDPACAYDFCRLAGTGKDRLVMVGDTLTDMRFAKNAGIMAVGVAKNDRNKEVLAPYADVVVDRAAAILDVLND